MNHFSVKQICLLNIEHLKIMLINRQWIKLFSAWSVFIFSTYPGTTKIYIILHIHFELEQVQINMKYIDKRDKLTLVLHGWVYTAVMYGHTARVLHNSRELWSPLVFAEDAPCTWIVHNGHNNRWRHWHR